MVDPRPRRRWLRAAGRAALILAVLAAGAWAASRRGEHSQPSFQRMTFRYGAVASARFAPDGRTVFYSATWDGASLLQLYSARTDARGGSELPERGQMVAISASGDLAFFPDRPFPAFHDASLGLGHTLATVPLTGGAPREVLSDVIGADWSPEMFPDGRRLAVVRERGGSRRLEFPIGHALYQTNYGLRAPRFSPRAT